MTLLPASVGIIFNDDNTQVLLVQRRDVPVWVLPGGGVDVGESFEKALLREIDEETGFQVQILRKSAEYTPINHLASLTHVFVCQITDGKMGLSEETRAIRFFPLADLPSSLFFPHRLWLNEALSNQAMIQRPLTEITYWKLFQYTLSCPWQVIRFAWTRFKQEVL